MAVTLKTVDQALEGSAMKTVQGKVTGPMGKRYSERLLAGETPLPIKKAGDVIVDGNHRYVAGRLVGREPPATPSTISRSDLPKVKPIQELKVSPDDWDKCKFDL